MAPHEEDTIQQLLPAEYTSTTSPWQPVHTDDPPAPPPQDTREADLAALAAQEKLGHDGKRQRVRPRRTVDPFGGLERWKIFRTTKTSIHDQLFMRTNPNYLINLLPPSAYANPSTSFCTRYAHTSTNKIRCPVNIVKFTPDARRVLTGSTSGEFTLWNGLTFNFETILQAHDSAVRAMEWSYSGQWLISADNAGVIKYFQANMNNLQVFQGHQESIRDLSWAPNDMRFASGSDDGTIKIWNFEMMKEEKTLTGHGWDVKCVKWHPTKGLLVSGSKDNLVKFWDPRSSKVLTTLHGHKNTVQACAWSPSGNLVATASRDQFVKVYDIRAMKELVTLRGHKKEVCSVAWHPVHDDMLVSGGSEGSIIHWSMPDLALKDHLEFAHDSNVWSLAFHPLGHLLCSASNDHTTRFWSRCRPGGAIVNDRFHVGREKAKELGAEEIQEDNDDFVPGLNNFGGGGRGGRGGGRGGYNNNNNRSHNQNNDRSSFNNQNSNPSHSNDFRPPPPHFPAPPPRMDDGFIPGFGRGQGSMDNLPPGLGSGGAPGPAGPGSYAMPPPPPQFGGYPTNGGGYGDRPPPPSRDFGMGMNNGGGGNGYSTPPSGFGDAGGGRAPLPPPSSGGYGGGLGGPPPPQHQQQQQQQFGGPPQGGGMRRSGPLPSQQSALSRDGVQSGREGYGRGGGQNNGWGGNGGGGGRY